MYKPPMSRIDSVTWGSICINSALTGRGRRYIVYYSYHEKYDEIVDKYDAIECRHISTCTYRPTRYKRDMIRYDKKYDTRR